MEEINSFRVIRVGTYASNPITLAAAQATLYEVLIQEGLSAQQTAGRRLHQAHDLLGNVSRMLSLAVGSGLVSN